jgi:hypothetical protein
MDKRSSLIELHRRDGEKSFTTLTSSSADFFVLFPRHSQIEMHHLKTKIGGQFILSTCHFVNRTKRIYGLPNLN